MGAQVGALDVVETGDHPVLQRRDLAGDPRELGAAGAGEALEHLQGRVEVRFGWALASLRQDGESVTAVATDGREVRGVWLVGADRVGSAVRTALGLGFDGLTWDERFVATDIRDDFRALGCARTTMVVDLRTGATSSPAEPGEDMRA